DLEEHPVGEPRFETGAIRGLDRPGERHARRPLFHIGRAESRQLAGQKVSEAAWHAGQVLPGRHDPGLRLHKRAPSLSERAAFPYDKGLPTAPATTASYLMAVS